MEKKAQHRVVKDRLSHLAFRDAMRDMVGQGMDVSPLTADLAAHHGSRKAGHHAHGKLI